MSEILLGALGALLAVALVAAGAAMGWMVSKMLGGTQSKPKEPGEAERRQLMEEQKAFRQLLNYNVETAYGMNRGMEEDGEQK